MVYQLILGRLISWLTRIFKVLGFIFVALLFVASGVFIPRMLGLDGETLFIAQAVGFVIMVIGILMITAYLDLKGK